MCKHAIFKYVRFKEIGGKEFIYDMDCYLLGV
jgi:hypothetical protein